MLIENIAATDALATCCPALSIFAYLAKLEQQNAPTRAWFPISGKNGNRNSARA